MSSKRPAWLSSAPHLTFSPKETRLCTPRHSHLLPRMGLRRRSRSFTRGSLLSPHRTSVPPPDTPDHSLPGNEDPIPEQLPTSVCISDTLGHPDLRAFALDYLPGKAGLFVI